MAPAEGSTPLDMMFDKDWDIKSYPHLHQADGSNGLDQEREVKLTAQRYFVNRINHKEQHFCKFAPFLYAAVAHTEKKQLNRNLALSYSCGTKTQEESGGYVINNTDAYRVFSNIKKHTGLLSSEKIRALGKTR